MNSHSMLMEMCLHVGKTHSNTSANLGRQLLGFFLIFTHASTP